MIPPKSPLTMKILIVEDEIPAQIQLERLIGAYYPDFEIMARIESVNEAIKWLKEKKPDLIFMDVELSDGQCFDIFREVVVDVPVIITTAYDNFAIKAFKVNSVDYLLKPIEGEDFRLAVEKSLRLTQKSQMDFNALERLITKSAPREYKRRFITKHNDQIHVLQVEDIAYFYAEQKATFIVNKAGRRFISDYSLDNLEEVLDPKNFFRLSRGCIASINSVKVVSKYFNSRLKIKLDPPVLEEVIVSRIRVQEFLDWLEGL
jgi:DNA-binding LytR/AlgR family response regulator